MIPTVFFGLFCLGPLAVMGNRSSWMPHTVPWPAQQCVDVGRGFVGECVIAPDMSRERLFYLDTPPCHSLKCAKPRNDDGGYSMIKVGKPLDGTICGILQACREGVCVDINADEIPSQTGIRTTYDCRPPIIVPKPINDQTRINDKTGNNDKTGINDKTGKVRGRPRKRKM